MTRHEKPQPGHQVQIDVKFIAPLKGSRRKHHQFTAIDACTRLRPREAKPATRLDLATTVMDASRATAVHA